MARIPLNIILAVSVDTDVWAETYGDRSNPGTTVPNDIQNLVERFFVRTDNGASLDAVTALNGSTLTYSKEL